MSFNRMAYRHKLIDLADSNRLCLRKATENVLEFV